MVFNLASGCAVDQEEDSVIPHKGVAGRGLTAEIGHHPRDGQIPNPLRSKPPFEIGLIEGAVAFFGKDLIFRLNLNLWKKFPVRCSAEDHLPPPLSKDTTI